MYTVTLKAVLKVRAHAEESGAVESTDQGGYFREVKRRKRHIRTYLVI
jgi:hypothetical protein